MSRASQILALYEAHLRKISMGTGGRAFFCVNLQEYDENKTLIDNIIGPLGGVTLRFSYGMRLSFDTKGRAKTALAQIIAAVDNSDDMGAL